MPLSSDHSAVDWPDASISLSVPPHNPRKAGNSPEGQSREQMSSTYSHSPTEPPDGDSKQLFPPPPKPKKVSQRPSLSCVECSRRKTKCDKTVPCGPCQKRGKSHLCKVMEHGAQKGRREPSEPLAGLSTVTDPTSARHAAFSELEAFRTTVDLLRSRISGLEGLLATAFNPSSSPALHSSHQHYPPPGPYLDHSLPAPHTATAHTSYSSYHDTILGTSRSESREPSFAPPSLDEAAETSAASDLRGEEVEASVALEFMALGRHRTFGASNPEPPDTAAGGGGSGFEDPAPHAKEDVGGHAPGDGGSTAAPFLPSPSALFPTTIALAAAAPGRHQADALIAHSLDWLGWHHAAVHSPSFKQEVAEFWAWGDRRMDLCSPAWLGLWFALLVVGVGNLAEGQAASLGISEDERSYLARTWFDCAMSCLYAANFLQNHSVFALQAIAVLVVTGQDASTSNLVPTLLSTAISIAQDMGMHRMSSDHHWEASMRGVSHEVRVKSLIARETRKRIFWALTSQDWFGIPYRRTYAVQPTQVTTPLPCNAHDEDLMTGQLINRPPSEYTVVSKLLLWIQIARCLQEIFEHMDRNANPSYRFLLEVDERLSGIISNCPAWLHDDGPTEKMPPCVEWVRNTFRISSNHKVLTLHRPFLHRAFQDPRFESSRRRAITASRTILREAARCSDSRLWTIPYHISAAACVALLDIFQRGGSPGSSNALDEERAEVLGALGALERMQETSSIARRGVALISNLVAEEQKLREIRTASRGPKRSAPGGGGSNGREYTQVAKKMALSEISPPASNATTPSGSDSNHASPASHSFAPLYPASFSNGVGDGFKWDSAHDPALFHFGATNGHHNSGAGISGAPLPQEFLSVFLEHEFDPLDGAFVSGLGGQFGVSGDAFTLPGGVGFGEVVPGAWTI